MTQFLIVYDQTAGKVIELTEFSDSDRARALDERFELERRFQDHPHIEVVALGADSREDLESTHGRYFKTIAQLAEGS
jgi:hypothetical protein